MSTSQAAVPPRSGLTTLVDIVVAPNQAFERLRIAPTWGWAWLVASILGMAGFALAIPASLHGVETGGPALYAAQVQNLPADQQQAAVGRIVSVTKTVVQIQWIFVPIIMLIGSLIGTVVMLIGSTIARGDGTFKKLWALSINVGVVTVGLGLLVMGIICIVRGPASFVTPTDVQRSLPSLALLAPGAGVKVQVFLATFNVFQLWATALLALGMTVVARMNPVAAWITSLVMLFGMAALGASFAR